ncbi:MoaD/ThiS family protein [Glaciecola petra]|uniref:Molybdopterin synthase sulfur carrier subunit n=1 Tax=Glaciecola petra TaxID=3075602 RepID=A0ABU2ZTG3_9ALTE|nr:MoaD/ThiS family protein [Aestuariibacter sp. P117]MDT0595936.1 MoaD/ThiS family protein [Aestuariibacter sp. P117]
MITIKFFAFLRQQVGQEQTTMALEAPTTIKAIKLKLMEQGEEWELALGDGKVLSALNFDMVDDSTIVNNGDELAFFPPVTGG